LTLCNSPLKLDQQQVFSLRNYYNVILLYERNGDRLIAPHYSFAAYNGELYTSLP